jgi:spore germination protein YaaH
LEIGNKHKRKFFTTRLIVSFVFFIVLSFGLLTAYFWKDFVPNRDHVEAGFHNLTKPIFYKGVYFPTSAIGENEGLKLPLAMVQEWIDPSIIYEGSSDSVIITTKDKVLRFQSSQLTAFINEKPYTLKFPVEKKDGIVYVPIEPLKQLYQVDLRESESSGGTILVKQGDELQWGRQISKGPVHLRTGSSIQYPIVADVAPEEQVIVWDEQGDWYKVQKKDGYTGFVAKTDLALDHKESVPRQDAADSYTPWKPSGGKLNLTWEHVITKNPDTAKIAAMPGLNVVSPTWFSLADGEGNVRNLADISYAKWAKSNQYQVWALFSNGFDPKRTTEALSTYDRRMFIVKQLLGFAKMYQLNGINIDFENVSLKDKENLVQFVREMTPLLHEQGLVVSIDVTPKSTNEMWSLFYDRPALASILDYMMVMAYDEYWATSPKSGSVSSLPWMENSVARLLNEDKIPSSKLVLGVPFYTRVWTEELKDGKTSVSSKAVSMDAVQKIMKDKNLTPTFLPEAGQNYAEYKEENKLTRIWIEDEVSMKARINLVEKYQLAGIATWRRGFELPEMWNTIQATLK